MQEKRHDRVVEMRLCFFLGKVGDYNVSFVETRMCRSTCRITFRTPLDYLYAALPDGQDKPLLYFNLKLQKLCEEKQMLGQWDNMVKKHKKSKSKRPKYA